MLQSSLNHKTQQCLPLLNNNIINSLVLLVLEKVFVLIDSRVQCFVEL